MELQQLTSDTTSLKNNQLLKITPSVIPRII